MASFILRRLLVSVLIIIAASFLMYMLVAYSADPLQDLRSSNSPNKTQLISARVQLLQLDVVPPLRWLLWLGGAAKCLIPFANACDLGSTVSNAKVTDILPQALGSTVQLVTLALILAILLGVTIGIVTALRQYSGLDNVVTFLSFFLYSLPAFLVAVLLKEFVAIGFNNFLAHPTIPWWVAVIIGVVAGLIWQSLIGGDRLASRGELQKLALYAEGSGEVSLADVRAVIGDASAMDVDEVVDAAAGGDATAVARTYRRLVSAGTPSFVILGAIIRHFGFLHRARAAMERGDSADSVVARAVPPVFFQRRPAVIRQLDAWRLPMIERAMAGLDRAMVDSRLRNAIDDEVVGQALLMVAAMAAARRAA